MRGREGRAENAYREGVRDVDVEAVPEDRRAGEVFGAEDREEGMKGRHTKKPANRRGTTTKTCRVLRKAGFLSHFFGIGCKTHARHILFPDVLSNLEPEFVLFI